MLAAPVHKIILKDPPGFDSLLRRRFHYVDQNKERQELSAVKIETLQQELEAVTQLMDIETDNKWAILTVVLLMKALDPVKYKEDIMNNLDKLEALDLTRINYYKDLRSKFIVEDLIDVMDSSPVPQTNISLREQKLTKFYHPELLPALTHLDLTGNQLTEVKHFSHLQNLQELTLDDNQVDSCEGLQCLQHLERLSLRNNLLACPDSLQALTVSCPRLKSLDVSGNPVCDSPVHLDSIREMLPNVELIPHHS